MVGEHLRSSQCLQLSPVSSVLNLYFCLSQTRRHPITDVWLDHKLEMEKHSLPLFASPDTKSCWLCFLIMSPIHPLLAVTTITCLYCFSNLFNCSQFFQCCLPPIHFLQGSQKDSFKWESDCVLEILQWPLLPLG